LYAGLGKALSETARKVILSLGKKLLGSGSLISTAVNLFTFGFGGQIAEQAASGAAEWIKTDRTAEEDYRTLAAELRKQRSKFLVIIDDIDRLTPEQTLLIFRLVKSVGRLPNILYLLVFDRDLAERLLQERYPAERHYLEKIVQAAFEVPLPESEVLHGALLSALVRLAAHPEGDAGVRFRNILADVVNPLITLPRDLVRYMGNLSVSWAAIGDEVDFADLLAIEALRLFHFPVYQAIRDHKTMLCGTGTETNRQRGQQGVYDEIFLSSASNDREREYFRTAVRRLFPRLDSVWANTFHSASAPIWRAQRRICDPSHFSSYFKLALGSNVISRKLLDDLSVHLQDRQYVQTFFRERTKIIRKSGHSEIPIVLDDLTGMADRISPEKTGVFLSALFEIADELDLERDEERGGFGFGTTYLRMHWLINELVRDRLPQADRGTLLQGAVETASLGWAVDLTSRIYSDHHPRSADKETPLERRLVDDSKASDIIQLTVEKIRRAAASGAVLNVRNLLSVLYRWREFSDGANGEVRRWTDAQLSSDDFVIRLADAVTSTVWVTSLGLDGMGDRVSQGVPQAQIEGLETILDVDRFLARVSELEVKQLLAHEKQIVARFREGMKRHEEQRRRRAPPDVSQVVRDDDYRSAEEIHAEEEIQQESPGDNGLRAT
jgi:predicted KAP-like P-loop ATPase